MRQIEQQEKSAIMKTMWNKLPFVNRLRQALGWVLSFFRRLQWKLTLAYTLFTVVTILILGGIALTFLWYVNFRSSSLPGRIADGLIRANPAMVPYLEQTPPDREGLNQWLQGVTLDNNLVINIHREEAQEDDEKVPAQFGRVAIVAIVDPEGKVLAVTPTDAAKPGDAFQEQLPPIAVDGFRAALRGETDPSLLSIRDSEGYMVATAPIFGADEQLLGAIYAKLAIPLGEGEFLQLVLEGTILPVALAMLVVGIIAGILFGFLISRGLIRRLRSLDEVVDAWGQGNFEVLASDRSGDELGHLTHHLNHMALQLENLLHTRQELATLEERNRLARDLHDSVKQQVFATAMQVGAARALLERSPDEAKTHLGEADQLVRQAQQELTTLILELRPAALEDRGLARALQDYVADWSRQTNITAEMRISGERSLELSLEQTLFRVAQEALSNIARHSKASTAEIHLAWEQDNVRLVVSDNGRGFDVGTANGKGMGLQSMQERMESIGGHLTVESNPGVGTQVTAQLDRCC